VSELNPRQRAFVNAYVGEANGNGTKAAIAAGYSQAAAGQQASRMLKDASIREAIDRRLDREDLRTDAILKRLGKIAHSTPDKPPTAQDIIAAVKVILQVNGALQAKQQPNTGVTVNIGFLQTPSTQSSHELPAITISSTVKELTPSSQDMSDSSLVMTQHPQLVPREG
jgi:hypothetical protein